MNGEYLFSECDVNDINGALEEDFLKPKIRRKLMALKMRSSGIPLEMIATSLSVSVRSISNYINEFRNGGLSSIMTDRAYSPESSVNPFMDELRESFKQEPVGCAKQAAVRIRKITGIGFSPSQTRRIMHRLGMRYRKAGQVPGKANGDAQLEFLDDKLRPKLQEAKEGKRKVFFVDASHYVMGAMTGMLWSFTRVFVRGASGRKRYNVLGALDSETNEVITVSNDSYITATSVCDLMNKISQLYPDTPITLVLDNARYQKCKVVFELANSLNIELLHLPPYSPNLNIIERLWKHVKQSCLKNTYYETFAEFRSAIDSQIQHVNNAKEQFKSLFSQKFQIINTDSKTGIL